MNVLDSHGLVWFEQAINNFEITLITSNCFWVYLFVHIFVFLLRGNN